MLVLTRKLQEQIQIGDNITISILRVKGNSVRIGIQAPRDVRVTRNELPLFTDASPVASAEFVVGHEADGVGGPEMLPSQPESTSEFGETGDEAASRLPALRRFRQARSVGPAMARSGACAAPSEFSIMP